LFLAPLILLALTIGVPWKTLLTSQYQEFDKPDLTNQVAPGCGCRPPNGTTATRCSGIPIKSAAIPRAGGPVPFL